MSAALAGLIAGSLHVVSGPDHVAALAPMAARSPARAVRTGALWGLGHGLGVLGAGLVARALSALIELDAMSALAERAVGVILVVVGVRAIVRACRAPRDAHPHAEGASAVGLGLVHGAAGAGHVFAVLPTLALSTLDASLYLVLYLLSAVATMALAGALAGRALADRREEVRRVVEGACGALASAVGAAWIATS